MSSYDTQRRNLYPLIKCAIEKAYAELGLGLDVQLASAETANIFKAITDAGYRKQADVIDDFVKRLEQKAVIMGCWVTDHEGDYDAVAIHDVYEIAQEMKGAEEMSDEQKQQDWISVDETLPEVRLVRDVFNRPSEFVSDVVLVCIKSTECDGVHYYVTTDLFRGKSLDDLHWMRCNIIGGSAIYSQEILAWMPLPQPPTEKGE